MDTEVIRNIVANKDIISHLETLFDEFQRYFPHLYSIEEHKFARNPFDFDINTLPEHMQEQANDLKHDSAAKGNLENLEITSFWIKCSTSYPLIAGMALKFYIPFSTTYLCKKGFSVLVAIKTKQRNKLDVESDLRCALSNIRPRISHLIEKIQHHPSFTLIINWYLLCLFFLIFFYLILYFSLLVK